MYIFMYKWTSKVGLHLTLVRLISILFPRKCAYHLGQVFTKFITNQHIDSSAFTGTPLLFSYTPFRIILITNSSTSKQNKQYPLHLSIINEITCLSIHVNAQWHCKLIIGCSKQHLLVLNITVNNYIGTDIQTWK